MYSGHHIVTWFIINVTKLVVQLALLSFTKLKNDNNVEGLI